VKAHFHVRASDRDVRQLLQEIDVPKGTAKLAVRDRLQADVLLAPDDLAYGVVLEPRQLFTRELPAPEALTLGQQLRRPQETANMVGAEWRFRSNRRHSTFSAPESGADR